MKPLRRALRALLLAVVATMVAALGGLLFSTTGARLLLGELLPGLVPGVTIQGIEGRLWGDLHIARLQYTSEGLDLALDTVALDWRPLRLLRGELAILGLEIDEARVGLRETPDEPPEPRLTRLPLDLVIAQARLARLRIAPAGGEPIALDALTLAARWRGAQVVIEQVGVTTPWVGRVEADGELELQPDGLRLAPLQLRAFGQATIEGRYAYEAASELILSWRDLHWPVEGAPRLRSASGRLDWSGRPEAWRYRLDTQIAAAGSSTALQAHGEGGLAHLGVERLVAALLGGRIEAQGRVDWDQGLRVAARGRLEDLDPAQAWPAWPGRIRGEFSADTQGGATDPQVRFTLALRDSKLRGYPLQAQLRGEYGAAPEGATALDIEDLILSSGRARLQARGRFWPDLDAQVQLAAPQLAPLAPGLAGGLHARLAARGRYEAPQLQLSANGRDLRYGDLRLGQLQLQGKVDGRDGLSVDARLTDLQAGLALDHAHLVVDGPYARQTLRLEVEGQPGRMQLALAGALDPAARRWQGQLTTAHLAPARFSPWRLEDVAALDLSVPAEGPPQLSLAPTCLASAPARACLRLLREAQRQRFAFRLEGFDLAYLQPLLPPEVKLALRLDGDGQIDLDARGLSGLRVDLRSGAGHWRQLGLPALELQPGRLLASEAPEGLRLALDLPLAKGGLRAEGLLAPGADFRQRALHGELRLDLPDLSWLRLLSGELSSASGRVEGRLDLAGTVERPVVRGSADLADGRFGLVTPGIELSPVTAHLQGQGTAPLRLSASAQSGGGTLTVEGTIDPWASPLRLDLRLRGQDVQVARTPEARAWVSPDLRLQLAEHRLQLGGSVLVPRAQITLDTLDQGIGPSADQVIVGPDAAERGTAALGIQADLAVRLGDQVSFEGFGLETRLAGALQVSQAPGIGTRGRGEIRLLDGRYKAYGQDLKIETGRLLFGGGPVTEPGLDLRATRSPREDIEVGVAVRGTLAKPQLSLFSTPSMTQQRQLSWLILGMDLDEGGAGAGDNKALLADAALSMGLAGSEGLAQRFGGKLGLDKVTIGAKPGQATGQARLTIGKYLTPGLYVSYGIGLFQPGYAVQIEYDIGHGFKISTETGTQTGGDLLYTIER